MLGLTLYLNVTRGKKGRPAGMRQPPPPPGAEGLQADEQWLRVLCEGRPVSAGYGGAPCDVSGCSSPRGLPAAVLWLPPLPESPGPWQILPGPRWLLHSPAPSPTHNPVWGPGACKTAERMHPRECRRPSLSVSASQVSTGPSCTRDQPVPAPSPCCFGKTRTLQPWSDQDGKPVSPQDLEISLEHHRGTHSLGCGASLGQNSPGACKVTAGGRRRAGAQGPLGGPVGGRQPPHRGPRCRRGL